MKAKMELLMSSPIFINFCGDFLDYMDCIFPFRGNLCHFSQFMHAILGYIVQENILLTTSQANFIPFFKQISDILHPVYVFLAMKFAFHTIYKTICNVISNRTFSRSAKNNP